MATDRVKLQLKATLQQRESELDAYEKADVAEYPGYTFLISAVVEAYGICPYLNVFDPALDGALSRGKWISEQSDNGAVYFREKNRVEDTSMDANLDREHEDLKTTLTNRVTETINNDIELAGHLLQTFDELLTAFWTCKRSKSMNKQMKELKAKVTHTMDAVMLGSRGLDFNRYMSIVHDVQIKYKPPLLELDHPDAKNWFSELCLQCTANRAQRDRNAVIRANIKRAALVRLADLIAQQFKLPQSGKYFQKWSSLTDEKQAERIQSYCEWYVRDNCLPTSLTGKMYDFVKEKLAEKAIRVSDIKWETKRGMINNINGIVLSYDNESFDVEKRIVTKARKTTTKKKGEDLFLTEAHMEIMTRAHRLLLYDIVSRQILNKEQIVQNVIYNLNAQGLPYGDLVTYLNARFDEMVECIRNAS